MKYSAFAAKNSRNLFARLARPGRGPGDPCGMCGFRGPCGPRGLYGPQGLCGPCDLLTRMSAPLPFLQKILRAIAFRSRTFFCALPFGTFSFSPFRLPSRPLFYRPAPIFASRLRLLRSGAFRAVLFSGCGVLAAGPFPVFPAFFLVRFCFFYSRCGFRCLPFFAYDCPLIGGGRRGIACREEPLVGGGAGGVVFLWIGLF